MIPEKYLQELRTRFTNQIGAKFKKPSFQLDPLGNTILYDGPIKIGVVKLQYILEEPTSEAKCPMIPEKYLQKLSEIRARFIEQILDECNDPKVIINIFGEPIIYDWPIKLGTVKLECEHTDTGIEFRYILEKP